MKQRIAPVITIFTKHMFTLANGDEATVEIWLDRGNGYMSANVETNLFRIASLLFEEEENKEPMKSRILWEGKWENSAYSECICSTIREAEEAYREGAWTKVAEKAMEWYKENHDGSRWV